MVWFHFRGPKGLWGKKYIVVEGTKLKICDKENGIGFNSDSFDLAPEDGTVVMHEAVSSSELFMTAASDIPYILRLEFKPHTTCWPSRYKIINLISYIIGYMTLMQSKNKRVYLIMTKQKLCYNCNKLSSMSSELIN